MFLLADDPHHMHADINYVYYFLALSVILIVPLLFAAWKVMKYLEHRRMLRERNAMADKAEMGASASQQSGENGSKK